MDFNDIRKTIDKYDTPKSYNTFRKLINGNIVNLENLLHYHREEGIEYYPSAIVVLAIILDRKISEVINHCKYFKVHLKTINRSNNRSLQISAYLSRSDFELSVDRFIPTLHILNDFTQKFPGIGFYRLWQIEFENVTIQDMPDTLKRVTINPNEVPEVLRTEEDEKRIAQHNKDLEEIRRERDRRIRELAMLDYQEYKPLEYPEALMTPDMKECVERINKQREIEFQKSKIEGIVFKDYLANELKSLECSTIGSNPETITVTPAKVDIKIEPINTIKLK